MHGLHSFSQEQQKSLFTKMIFEEHELDFRDHIVRSLPSEPQYYERVRELALQKKRYALATLAAYRKDEDVELIKANLLDKESASDALEAIQQFPCPLFSSLLKNKQRDMLRMRKRFNFTQIRFFYMAVVQYQSQQARDMLKYALTHGTKSARQYHSEGI